jgi:predicted secreted protein
MQQQENSSGLTSGLGRRYNEILHVDARRVSSMGSQISSSARRDKYGASAIGAGRVSVASSISGYTNDENSSIADQSMRSTATSASLLHSKKGRITF